MNKQLQNWLEGGSASFAVCLLAVGMVVAESGFAAGRNPNPGILPVGASAYGKTYGEWGAAWWTWVLGLPPEENPVIDPTGELAGSGQEGPVFFLAGTFGGPAERTVTIPAGKAIFFPLVNFTFAGPEDTPFGRDIAEHLGIDSSSLTDAEAIRILTVWYADHVTEVSATIDGVPVVDPGRYRAVSPDYELVLDDGLAGYLDPSGEFLVGGLKTPAVADGYWLLLSPLSKGGHTIHFGGHHLTSVAGGDPFDSEFGVDITYHLTVE